MADGIVRILINAVDNYSKTLQGLDAALNIAGKGFNAFAAVAGAAFDATKLAADTTLSGVTKALDLAKIGGAFAEQESQLKNLAAAYGVNGDKILETINKVSQNTIKDSDAMRLAAKGIASSLYGPDFETVLTYVKKWSEATGESFTGIAETAFQAFATGKFSVLKGMGLAIDKSSTVTSVVRQMADTMGKFGEAAFNSGDNFEALAVQQEKFSRKIGEGINSSSEFQKLLNRLTDGVVDFVGSFNPAAITVFTDYLIASAGDIFNTFTNNFPEVKKIFDDVFQGGAQGFKSFSLAVTNGVFSVIKTIATAINTVVGFFQALNPVGNILALVGFVGEGISEVVKLILEGLTAVTNATLEASKSVIQSILDLVQSSPSLSEFLGIDPETVAQSLTSINRLQGSVRQISLEQASGIDELVKNLYEAADESSGAFDKFKINIDGIDELQLKAVNAINNINFEKAATTTKAAFKGVKTAVLQDLEDAVYEGTKKGSAKAESEAQKALKIQFDADTKSLQDQLKSLETSKKLQTGLGFSQADIDRTQRMIDDVKAKLSTRLTIGVDQSTGDATAKAALINWPAEFRAMGEYLLKFAVQKLRGENIPFALVTS